MNYYSITWTSCQDYVEGNIALYFMCMFLLA